jgi:drug/metabolite transporter (DMT)-like permease
MRRVWDHGYALLVLTGLFWSSNAIIGRGVHDLVPPLGLNFWRWVPTLPIFVALAWPHLRRDWPTVRREWRWMLFFAVIAVPFYNSCVYVGLDRTTALNMVLINASRPALIVLLSFLLYRIRVSRGQLVGLVCGLVGAGVIIVRGDFAVLLGLSLNPGDLWIFAATLSWAWYTAVLPTKRPAIHPTSFMAYMVAIGLVVLLPFYLWESLTVEVVPVTRESLLAIAVLAIFASVLAQLGYNRLVVLLGANGAGTVSYLVMAFGVLFAITLLGEAFHAYHASGLLLLVAGTWLVTRPAGRTPRRAA